GFGRNPDLEPEPSSTLAVPERDLRNDGLIDWVLAGELHCDGRHVPASGQVGEVSIDHREHFMLASKHRGADEDAELLHELARVTEVRTADVDTHLLRAFTLDDLPRLEGSVPVEDGERQRPTEVDDGRVLRPVGEHKHADCFLCEPLALRGG